MLRTAITDIQREICGFRATSRMSSLSRSTGFADVSRRRKSCRGGGRNLHDRHPYQTSSPRTKDTRFSNTVGGHCFHHETGNVPCFHCIVKHLKLRIIGHSRSLRAFTSTTRCVCRSFHCFVLLLHFTPQRQTT